MAPGDGGRAAFRRPVLVGAELDDNQDAPELDLSPQMIDCLAALSGGDVPLQVDGRSGEVAYVVQHDLICAWSWSRSVSQYQVAHGAPIRALRLHHSYLVTTDGDEVAIWSTSDLVCLDRVDLPLHHTDPNLVQIVSRDDGDFLVVSANFPLCRYRYGASGLVLVSHTDMIHGPVHSVADAAHPDTLFAALADSQFVLFDGRELRVTDVADCVAFCRGRAPGQYVLVAGAHLYVTDAAGRPIRSTAFTAPATCASSLYGCIAVGDCAGNVSILDWTTLRLQRTVAPDPRLGPVQVRSVAVVLTRPSRAYVVLVAYSSGVIHALDLAAARIVAERPSIASRINAACLVRSAVVLVSDRSLCLYQQGKLSSLPIRLPPITALCRTGPDQIMLGDGAGLIRCVNTTTGRLQRGTDLSPAGVARFVGLGQYLAVYQVDHRVVLLRGSERGLIVQPGVEWRGASDVTAPQVALVRTSTTLTLLHSTADECELQCAEIDADGERVVGRRPLTASEPITALAVHPSSRYVVLGLRSGQVEYRELRSEAVVMGRIDVSARVNVIEFDGTGAFMLIGAGPHLHLFQFGTGRRIGRVSLYNITSVLVDHTGPWFYVVGPDYISKWAWPISVQQTIRHVVELIADLDLGTFWSRYPIRLVQPLTPSSSRFRADPVAAELGQFFAESDAVCHVRSVLAQVGWRSMASDLPASVCLRLWIERLGPVRRERRWQRIAP